ncbi:MAG: UDP-N-acetylmuramate dehydrogenase [Clostridia bacterium]|nr:UDP-N-acetylmuramate dehydrogenase [Clostridia bacterium]
MGFKEELLVFPHAKIKYNEPMKNHTSLGVGGDCDYYAEVCTLYGLNCLFMLAKENGVTCKVIGNGTNLLVSDNGFCGLIINVSKINDVFFKRDCVRAMAGASLEKLIRFTVENGLSGIESLSGIPASVGGAVVMNAGAFGHNISDCIETVETLKDGKLKVYDKQDCRFGYRKSRFLGKDEVVVSATFKFKERERSAISCGVESFAEIRRTIQPSGRSCGSVFKNPKGFSAGQLIERAGLKGLSVGGAKISEKHGNFIITSGRATAMDVFNLITTIKEKIKDEFGIELEKEVELVGEF